MPGKQLRGEISVSSRAGIKNCLVLTIYFPPWAIFASHQEPQVVQVFVAYTLDPRIQRCTSMYKCAGMKAKIRLQPAIKIFPLHRLTHLFERIPNSGNVLVGKPWNGNRRGQRKQEDNFGRISVDNVRIEIEQAGTFVMFSNNQPFLLQHSQGFAKGRASDAKLLGQSNLGQPHAGFEPSSQNHGPKFIVNLPDTAQLAGDSQMFSFRAFIGRTQS